MNSEQQRAQQLKEIRSVDMALIREFREFVQSGAPIPSGSKWSELSLHMTQRANLITAEMNGAYHTPEELRALLSELTCSEIPGTVGLVPPFTTDFGANIVIGRGVYINAFVSMQDQGGILIDDGALIGHHTVLATLNHEMEPARRHDLIAKPIHIGKNVWIGAHCTILQNVTVGDNAVVAAGAVVTKDVPPNTVVGGVPARFIRNIPDD